MSDGTDGAVRGNILVVDDTPGNLHLLAGLLREQGYKVRPVPSGKLALMAAQKEPPDLILLDINMPEMNGYEVCQRLKEDQSLREIPVIFISVLDEAMDKVRAFSVGGVDYVTKPFQFEEVQARVETHLRLRRQQMQIERQYQELCELEELRDNLVHMIVHDMRSPLTGIVGLLWFLQQDLGDALPETQARNLEQALTAGQALGEMVSSLLDISRMEAGEMPLNKERCDLRTAVADALTSLVALAERHQVSFDDPGSPVVARCDAEVIRRVFANLISNAIKFTTENGEIHIRLEQEDHAVRARVSDTGPGIPLKYQERIFGKFGQVEVRHERSECSTGLGLAFCKMAVEAHGGSIGVDSVVGEGSTFWFALPSGPASGE